MSQRAIPGVGASAFIVASLDREGYRSATARAKHVPRGGLDRESEIVDGLIEQLVTIAAGLLRQRCEVLRLAPTIPLRVCSTSLAAASSRAGFLCTMYQDPDHAAQREWRANDSAGALNTSSFTLTSPVILAEQK